MAAEMDWAPLKLSVFSECQSQLGFDEFLHTGSFDTYRAMNCLAIGSPKIDSHFIGQGQLTVGDLLKSDFYLPDQNITEEELTQVCGYLIDCQVSRLEGHRTAQNILTCVYLHRDYHIQNPILKYLISSFVAAFAATETFANNFITRDLYTIWYPDDSFSKFAIEVTIPELRSSLSAINQPSLKNLVDICSMELDFAEYLNSNLKSNPPTFVPLPQTSKSIGFCQYLHYRDLSSQSPPPMPQILDHKTAIEKLSTFISSIPNLPSFPKESSLASLLSDALTFSSANQVITFARFIVFFKTFPSPERFQSFESALKAELSAYHPPESLNAILTPFAQSVYSFTIRSVFFFLMPLEVAHHELIKALCRNWGSIQMESWNIQKEANLSATFPPVNAQSNLKDIQSYLMIWNTTIAVELAKNVIELGFKSGVYSETDIAWSMVTMRALYEVKAAWQNKVREINVIYKMIEERKGKKRTGFIKSGDVAREMSEETAAELEMHATASYCFGCFYLSMVGYKTGALSYNKGEFYRADLAYKNKAAPLFEMLSLNLMPVEKYESEFKFTDRSIEELSSEGKRLFDEAKGFIGRIGQNKSKFAVDLLRQIIISSLALAKCREGTKLEYQYNGTFPCFKIK